MLWTLKTGHNLKRTLKIWGFWKFPEFRQKYEGCDALTCIILLSKNLYVYIDLESEREVENVGILLRPLKRLISFD